ncbi:MAG TPA: FG-GAP repeat protein [Polyangiaceae bacterium]|jgi:hypothetical protein|nr:FG-GAP repeat protein [Polyangiaceae bacterium]
MKHSFTDRSCARVAGLGKGHLFPRLALASSAFLFVSCGSFELEQELVGTPAAESGGRAIALGKSLAAVGVGSGSVDSPFAVDVFERNRRGGWSFVQRLTASADDRGRFGTALALHGNTLVVGAPENDDSGTPEVETGYVAVFERGAGGFVRTHTVLPESFTLPPGETTPGEFSFGASVSLDEQHLAVGAKRFHGGRGRVFVFDRSDYSQQVELAEPAALERFDANFGDTVQLSHGTLLVTRPDTPANTPPPKNGKVYVYTSADGFATAEVLQSVTADGSFDGFGNAGTIFGGTIAVRDELGVQLFERSAGAWQPLAQIATGDGDRFSIALDAEHLFVGEPDATVAGLAGAGQVLVFDRSDVPPTLETTLRAPAPEAGLGFGEQVAVALRTLGVTTGDFEQAFVFRRN